MACDPSENQIADQFYVYNNLFDIMRVMELHQRYFTPTPEYVFPAQLYQLLYPSYKT